jgi:hypothetical protein
MKCHDCHHEWEGSRNHCDWCNSTNQPIVLKEKSELELTISLMVGKVSKSSHKASKVGSFPTSGTKNREIL